MSKTDFPDGLELILRDGEGRRVIRTLDQAEAFLREHRGAGNPQDNWEGILRRLQRGPVSPSEKDDPADAAGAFIAWAQASGLLIESRRI